MNLTFGSVCSGIEAASVAWGPLGWQACWFSEIDAWPSSLLHHRYPEIPNLGDMRHLAALVDFGEVEAPDVLVGGTPCQSFSVAGMRAGLADPRGQLTISYVELLDAIDRQRSARNQPPCIAVWENVPGVLSSKDNAFGCLLAALAGDVESYVSPGGKWPECGVVFGPSRAIAWRCVDAQYFGLAQRRRRVLLVASARSDFHPAQVLLEFDGVRRDSPPSRGSEEDVASTLTGGARKDGSYSLDDGALIPITAGTLRSTDGGAHLDQAEVGHLIPTVSTLMGSFGRLQGCAGQDANHGHSHLVVAYGGNNQSGPIDIATARNAHPSPQGRLDFESETFILQPLPFDTTQITSATNQSKPMPGDPCHPLSAGAHPPAIAFHGSQDPDISGNITHPLGRNYGQEACVYYDQPTRVRRLTPRECERLQGFADDYTLVPWANKPASECPDGHRYKGLGNSMATPCMRWLGLRIERALRKPWR